MTGLASRKKELEARRLASARRHEASLRLREARQKLTNKADKKQAFEYELLEMFVKNELSAVLTIPLLAVIVALVCLTWASFSDVAIWLACILSTKALLLILCYRFSKAVKETTRVSSWRYRLASVEFIYGLCWASIVFIDVANSYQAHFFIFSTLLAVIAIRMMFASTVIEIVYASTLPITIAVITKFGLSDDPFYWSLAGMLAGLNVYFSLLAQSINGNVMTMLTYRAEKDLLIAEIEEAKAFSDEARRQAEEANFAKSRFLATMSHELRTPLNAILGFSEVMKDEFFGPHEVPSYKDYSRHIHESGKHLLNLINEILDLSRIEAGRYELHEEHLRLSDIAGECCRLLKMRAENKGLKIIELHSDEKVQLWADERAVRQICLNLLSNAIKFTPSGGQVYVKTEVHESGDLRLSIRDTGPGIPKEEIPTVMMNFGQGSLAHEIAEGGTGLGLPIVKGLIEMHQGVFDLQSELRKGTEAIIIFPQTRVTQALPRLPVSGEKTISGPPRNAHLLNSAKDVVSESDKQLAGLLLERLSRLGRPHNLVRQSSTSTPRKSLADLAYEAQVESLAESLPENPNEESVSTSASDLQDHSEIHHFFDNQTIPATKQNINLRDLLTEEDKEADITMPQKAQKS